MTAPIAQDRCGHPVSLTVVLLKDDSPILRLSTVTDVIDIPLSEITYGAEAVNLAGQISLLLGIETINIETVEP